MVSRRRQSEITHSQKLIYPKHFYAKAIFRVDTGLASHFYLKSKENG